MRVAKIIKEYDRMTDTQLMNRLYEVNLQKNATQKRVNILNDEAKRIKEELIKRGANNG